MLFDNTNLLVFSYSKDGGMFNLDEDSFFVGFFLLSEI